MRFIELAVPVLLFSIAADAVPAQRPSALDAVAQAMGGKDRVLAVRTLVVEGSGEVLYFGQTVTPYAKTNIAVTSFRRSYDFADRRDRSAAALAGASAGKTAWTGRQHPRPFRPRRRRAGSHLTRPDHHHPQREQGFLRTRGVRGTAHHAAGRSREESATSPAHCRTRQAGSARSPSRDRALRAQRQSARGIDLDGVLAPRADPDPGGPRLSRVAGREKPCFVRAGPGPNRPAPRIAS